MYYVVLHSLTALSETPEAGGTVPGNPEGSPALLVLRLGAGQAAAALVQRVEPGVAADRGLAGLGSTGAAEALSQGNAGKERKEIRKRTIQPAFILTSLLTTTTTGSCSLLGSQETTEGRLLQYILILDRPDLSNWLEFHYCQQTEIVISVISPGHCQDPGQIILNHV